MSDKNKVLIVDDDKFLLDMYSVKFTENGFEVKVAYNGPEALEAVENGYQPDVCLVDIIMPNMDGFEVIDKLKQLPNYQNTALIILSNLGQQEDIDKGKKTGADGYIVKASATPSEVVERVQEIINNKK
ncbi:MAG: response regulator [Patescibacteria group bacterium]